MDHISSSSKENKKIKNNKNVGLDNIDLKNYVKDTGPHDG
jgi:hypothetical protein